MECYLSRNYKETNSAGNKAKTDMEAIMRAMGLRNVGLPQSRYRDPVRHFFATLASVAKSEVSFLPLWGRHARAAIPVEEVL